MAELLTKEKFAEKIFDFENEKNWNYKGDKPAVIDFYADWCGPCKQLTPIIDELNEEYKDRIDIYKVDTEQEQELSAMFGIRSIPSILFIPVEGQPQMAQGALPKTTFTKAFKDIFNIE